MAITITQVIAPNIPDITGREIVVDGTAALSGNYGTNVSNGDTLDLTQFGDQLKSSQLPTKVEVFEDPASGTAPFFLQMVYCPGTTQKNGVVAMALAGMQLTGGTAYSGQSTNVSGAVLRVRAWFPAY